MPGGGDQRDAAEELCVAEVGGGAAQEAHRLGHAGGAGHLHLARRNHKIADVERGEKGRECKQQQKIGLARIGQEHAHGMSLPRAKKIATTKEIATARISAG
jgi:hypothetical protein